MKNQALFSSKAKSKKFKCCLLPFLFGALRFKIVFLYIKTIPHYISPFALQMFKISHSTLTE